MPLLQNYSRHFGKSATHYWNILYPNGSVVTLWTCSTRVREEGGHLLT